MVLTGKSSDVLHIQLTFAKVSWSVVHYYYIFGIVDPCGDQNSEDGALMDDEMADSAYSQDPSHLTQESTNLAVYCTHGFIRATHNS